MIELEVKELIARHKSDMSEKGAQITQLEELNLQLTGNLDQKITDKDELNTKIKALQEGETFAIRLICSILGYPYVALFYYGVTRVVLSF